MLGTGITVALGRGGARNGSERYAVAGYRPPLVLDFSRGIYRVGQARTSLASAVTFTRSSSAWMRNSAGTLTTVGSNAAREGHHVWNGSAWVNEGLLHEAEARTQLLHTTDALVTQSHTVTAVPHTLHFTGTGTITLTGASTAGPLVGTGANDRVSLTFTPSAASLTLTASGTVTDAQLEVGSTQSSYIPNLAGSGTVTRAADSLVIPAANLPYSAVGMTIQMQGRVTYADLNGYPFSFYLWQLDAPNRINLSLRTVGSNTGRVYAQQFSGGNTSYTQASAQYTPGTFVPFNVATRHQNSLIQLAKDGASYTADTSSNTLADLSATDFKPGHQMMGTIKEFRMWGVDLGETGIEEATA